MRVEGQRRERIGFGVIGGIVALLKSQPRGIVAVGIKRIDDLQPFGGCAGVLKAGPRPSREHCRRPAASCPFAPSA